LLATTTNPASTEPFMPLCANGARADVRHPHDARVLLDGVVEGWSLNLSAGGVRVVVPEESADAVESVVRAERIAIAVDGDDHRCGRVVWHAFWPGGVVLGIAFAR
jgi:hypothetical protein